MRKQIRGVKWYRARRETQGLGGESPTRKSESEAKPRGGARPLWASVSVHPGYRCWLSINACVFNVNAKCVIESIRAITIPIGAPKDNFVVSALVSVCALALCGAVRSYRHSKNT